MKSLFNVIKTRIEKLIRWNSHKWKKSQLKSVSNCWQSDQIIKFFIANLVPNACQ